MVLSLAFPDEKALLLLSRRGLRKQCGVDYQTCDVNEPPCCECYECSCPTQSQDSNCQCVYLKDKCGTGKIRCNMKRFWDFNFRMLNKCECCV
uniref:Clone 998 transcribed RNA sequence n=1 Tax=Plectreurys tristis TaxID=33319 RepID=A0A0C4W4D7_PLETR|nr:venom peptide U6-PLTX-Pt1a [Plectreurys tristis]